MKLYYNIIIPCFLLIILLSSQAVTAKTNSKISIQSNHAEQELIQILDLIQAQKTDIALLKSTQLSKKYPNFKLLNALHADLIYSQYNKLSKPFNLDQNKKNQQKLISEASARLDSVANSTQLHQQHLPQLLKYIDTSQRYFFVIDFSISRLYLFKNKLQKAPQLILDHYLTIGENGFKKQVTGDKKTPLGVYHVTSFLADKQLPELYGWGAFPINYPNDWDKRNHRTGSGIWLHGVPRNTYSRPPLDSKGCLVISNDFLINLANYLTINTPVILTQSIHWVDNKEYMKQSFQYKKTFDAWKHAWQNKNLKEYLAFYSKSFHNKKKNYHSWAKHKQKIFKKTKHIQLQIEKLSIFSYPGELDLLSVSFYQRYKGDKYQSKGYKQQYWKREKDGKWRIIYEYTRDL